MVNCISVFESWIRTHPNQIEPQLGLGEMWLFLNQNQRAKEVFRRILMNFKGNYMALIGLCQAKIKLGEDSVPELRKAWLLDNRLTKAFVETHFDFRSVDSGELEAMSLKEVAETYRIPLSRILERARNGTLPAYPPGEDGLLRFSRKDLDLYDHVLRKLGFELSPKLKKQDLEPEAIQPSLFGDD